MLSGEEGMVLITIFFIFLSAIIVKLMLWIEKRVCRKWNERY